MLIIRYLFFFLALTWMASSLERCSLCKPKVAVIRCRDCEEFFCLDCKISHSKFKPTREHQVVDVNNYKKLPDFVKSITNNCNNHNEKYSSYCETHNELLCSGCVLNHEPSSCTVLKLNEVTQDEHLSIINLEEDLTYLHDNLNKVISRIRENKSTVVNKENADRKEILYLRRSIDSHLNRIEQELKDKISSNQKTMMKTLSSQENYFKSKRESVEKMRKEIEYIKQYAGKFQTFVGIQKMKANVDGQIKDQLENVRTEEVNTEFCLSQELVSLVDRVKSFGSSSIETVEVRAHIVSNPMQAQVAALESVERKSLLPEVYLKHEIEFPNQLDKNPIEIRGCEILASGELVFIDAANKRLMKFLANGHYQKDVANFNGTPFDVTYTENDQVAVTIRDTKEVVFNNINTGKEINKVNLGHQCLGIDACHETKTLAVFTLHKITANEIILLTYNGDKKPKFVKRIPVSNFASMKHLSLHCKEIKASDANSNKVACIDVNGQTLWHFKMQDVLSHPKGISANINGDIFIAGKTSNNVIFMTADGKRHKTIIDKDVLKEPYALNFSSQRSELLICNLKGPCFLYNIKKFEI